MSAHTIPVNGVNYHIELDGVGAPLLLLHGFTGSAKNWEPLIPALATNHTVIRVDLLGHGHTSAPTAPQRYAMPGAACELIEIMAQLGHPQFHLLGYSMGGRLALYIAANHPQHVKSLVLESASPGLAAEAERQERIQNDESLANRIERQGIESFVDFWENIALFGSQRSAPQAARERLRAQRLTNRTTGIANSLRGMGTGVQPSQWENLTALTMPTLLITGTLDTKFMGIAEEMAGHIPYVQRQIIAEAGHTTHFEKPTAFQTAVLEFLRDHH